MSNLTPEVQAIGQIHLEGNVIPHSWYQYIRFENGKVDTISIMLLSEIVYWYRPTVIRDELTGNVIEVRKKFKADALQKNKKALADQFGLTERQVKDSLCRLEKLGLIVRDYRTVFIGDIKMANVLFIKINPDKIRQISEIQSHTYDVKTSDPRRSNVTPQTLKRQTNTYTTPETTQDIDYIAPAKADAKKKESPSLIKKREHVSVSEDQHKKLVAKHGEAKAEQAYDFLNDWKESKAETDPKALTKHTDYYRITKWVMKEIENPTAVGHVRPKGKLSLPSDGQLDPEFQENNRKKLKDWMSQGKRHGS
jgi:hypothetical protein